MFKTFTIFFFGLIFCFSGTAKSENNVEKYASGALISSVNGVGNLDVIPMGLDLKLVDGWYTYWRMAGDNGLPPKFDWSASQNVKEVKIHWPVPSRFTLMDMHSFGYSGNAFFPLDVVPVDAGKPVNLAMKLDIMVCHDICIPESLNLSYDLPAGNSTPLAQASLIDAAIKKLPSMENIPSLGFDTAVLGKDAVVIGAYSKNGFADSVDLILETDPPLLFAPPLVIQDELDKGRAVLKIPASNGMDLTKELFGKKATILLIHKGQAIEREISF